MLIIISAEFAVSHEPIKAAHIEYALSVLLILIITIIIMNVFVLLDL